MRKWEAVIPAQNLAEGDVQRSITVMVHKTQLCVITIHVKYGVEVWGPDQCHQVMMHKGSGNWIIEMEPERQWGPQNFYVHIHRAGAITERKRYNLIQMSHEPELDKLISIPKSRNVTTPWSNDVTVPKSKDGVAMPRTSNTTPSKPDDVEILKPDDEVDDITTPKPTVMVVSNPLSKIENTSMTLGKIRKYIPVQNLMEGRIRRVINLKDVTFIEFWDSLLCDWRYHYLDGVSTWQAEDCGLEVYAGPDRWIMEVNASMHQSC